MKKIILSLFFIGCLGLCFSQTSILEEAVTEGVYKLFPFLKDFPINQSPSNDFLENKGFEKKHELQANYDMKNFYTLPFEKFSEYTFERGNTKYTPYRISYVSYAGEWLYTEIELATDSNFYWIRDGFSELSFYLALYSDGTIYNSDFFGYKITEYVPFYKDGKFCIKLKIKEKN